MKKSIEGFCKARKNGLFLLDLPTGFGKTYNVLDFIADNYDKPEFAGSRFFFITTLKKIYLMKNCVSVLPKEVSKMFLMS